MKCSESDLKQYLTVMIDYWKEEAGDAVRTGSSYYEGYAAGTYQAAKRIMEICRFEGDGGK